MTHTPPLFPCPYHPSLPLEDCQLCIEAGAVPSGALAETAKAGKIIATTLDLVARLEYDLEDAAEPNENALAQIAQIKRVLEAF